MSDLDNQTLGDVRSGQFEQSEVRFLDQEGDGLGNWALRDALNSTDNVSRYADATLLSILRDADEAQLVVDRVLGGLLAYDSDHGTDLTGTLDTFLRLDKSWQSTADEVGSTARLSYRLRRIEAITGRNLSTTAHVAEPWLALRARDLVTAPGT